MTFAKKSKTSLLVPSIVELTVVDKELKKKKLANKFNQFSLRIRLFQLKDKPIKRIHLSHSAQKSHFFIHDQKYEPNHGEKILFSEGVCPFYSVCFFRQ